MESLAGQLLIASPAILDPNFRRTVVFVTVHTDEGAVGLILNRPSDTTVAEAVPQLGPLTGADEPVFVGGPVNPNGVNYPGTGYHPGPDPTEGVDANAVATMLKYKKLEPAR